MKQIVFVGLIGLCFGIVCAEWQNLKTSGIILFFIIFCSLSIIYFLDQRIRTSTFYLTLIFICASSIGIIRTGYAYETLPKPFTNIEIQQTQIFTAKIISNVDVRENSLEFIAKPILKDGDTKNRKAVPDIRVITNRFSDVSYGDIITLEGKMQDIVSNDETYARIGEAFVRKGVLYEMKSPVITVVSHDNGNYFKQYSTVIHDWIQKTIDRYVMEPSAGFIKGILIGEKHGISKEWYQAFTVVGLTHVIVLSGYNLTVLFAWIRFILRHASFVVQNIFGAGGVIVLVLISGAEAPSIRAGILVLIVALSSLFLRQKDTGYFLSVTILLMLLWNPWYLLYDVSFQLSIAATYGLVYAGPIIEAYLVGIPKSLTEIIRDTAAAQLTVLPLQLFYFGTVSLVSLFANILVLPFIPLLMILGTCILLTSFLPIVPLVIGTGAGIVSDGLLFLVKHMSHIALPVHFSISLLGLSIAYLFLIVWILKYKKI